MSYPARQSVTGMLDKDRVAVSLARSHYKTDRGIRMIYRIRASNREIEEDRQEPIKLLEVNAATFPAGIRPVYFSASAITGVPFPSVVVSVTPREYRQLAEGNLSLRDGWALAEFIAPPPRVRIRTKHLNP